MNQPVPGSFRIASYNIRKALGTDRKRLPGRILHVVSQLNADIVVLQEADLRLGKRPSALPKPEIEDKTGLVAIPMSVNPDGLGWHGNAILARPDIEVRHVLRLDLPGIEPRGAIVTDFALQGGPLRVVGVHLGLIRASRRKQLTYLLEKISALDSIPTVIAGDFNEWSLTVGLGRMARHFTIHAPGKSFHSNSPIASLDRIALDDRLTFRAAGVALDALSRKASDHLPIWMDITRRE